MTTATVTEINAWTPGDKDCVAPADADLEPRITCHRHLDELAASASSSDRKLASADLLACLGNPWYWLINHCATLDEHDAEHPYKRFPPAPQLQALADLWWWTGTRWPGLALPKSRKEMVTWLISLLFFGDCQFRPARRNLVQSYKLLESEAVIAKVKGVWERQPPWIRQPCTWTTTEARFGNDSVFIAAPGGAEQLQGPTLSGYFFDEVGDHEAAALTYEAALPAVGEGGRLVMVGRCPRSWWHDVFLADQIGDR